MHDAGLESIGFTLVLSMLAENAVEKASREAIIWRIRTSTLCNPTFHANFFVESICVAFLGIVVGIPPRNKLEVHYF